MRADDVPEEWMDALISQLPAKATAAIQEIDFRAAIAAVAPLIAKAERERCAKVAEQNREWETAGRHIAAAIRALPDGEVGKWNWLGGQRTADEACEAGWTYDSPCTTPAEVEALRAERDSHKASLDHLIALFGDLAKDRDALSASYNAALSELDRVHRLLETTCAERDKLAGKEDTALEAMYSYARSYSAAVSENATLRARVAELEDATSDMLAGWRYIRRIHGDLPGVGWDRAQQAVEAALGTAAPIPLAPLSAEQQRQARAALSPATKGAAGA